MDRIVEALPNIEAAINSGEMDTGVGLEGLAISLEKPMSSANQKGLFGNVPGPTGRIYPYA